MGGAFFFGGVEGLVDCCCMLLLDALEGCSKTPIKIVFFEHPLARCKRNRKTRTPPPPPKKKAKKLYTHFWGTLENGQEVVPPSFPQKTVFSQNPQKPYF